MISRFRIFLKLINTQIFSSTILLDFFNKVLSCQNLSTQEAQRMMEAGGGIEIPYDGDHLEIPVKTLKVRLVTVHKSHT